MTTQNERRRLVGKVASNKMMKTVVVEINTSYRHPLYGKVVHRTTRFKAHDEQGCQPGDTVRIVETRPMSTEKRWAVEEIINRVVQVIPVAEVATPEGSVQS